jgi:cell division ATPase FtsA
VASIIGTEDTIFVGLDVGTTKVTTLVGQLDAERNLRVI